MYDTTDGLLVSPHIAALGQFASGGMSASDCLLVYVSAYRKLAVQDCLVLLPSEGEAFDGLALQGFVGVEIRLMAGGTCSQGRSDVLLRVLDDPFQVRLLQEAHRRRRAHL